MAHRFFSWNPLRLSIKYFRGVVTYELLNFTKLFHKSRLKCRSSYTSNQKAIRCSAHRLTLCSVVVVVKIQTWYGKSKRWLFIGVVLKSTNYSAQANVKKSFVRNAFAYDEMIVRDGPVGLFLIFA
jgi:hypothetical protein